MALLIPLHQRSLLYSKILIGDSDNMTGEKQTNKPKKNPKSTEENSAFDGVDSSPLK